MYSEKVTRARIEQIMRTMPEWEPHYHTPTQVRAANAHFDKITIFDRTGTAVNFNRELDEEESAYITNERLLCKLDFRYALSRYCYIRDWNTNLVLFKPNVAQEIKLSIYSDLEERNVALTLLALKARQLGSSTLAEAMIWHRVTFYPRTYAIVGSNDPAKSSDMFDMVERMWEHMPWWLKPVRTSYSAGEFVQFGNRSFDSTVSIQHGTQKSGIGRGSTPNCGHLSEIADYTNPELLIDSSLIRAMHENPMMFLELESTANGRGTWWHRTWEENVNDGELARLVPTFLPWFVGSDIYPTDAWLRRRPIPEDWSPASTTIQHAAQAAAYVEHSPLLRKHLGTDWRMPLRQMWFYEVERSRAQRKGQLGLFLRELCATPDEAFASSNESVFSIELLTERRASTIPPLYVFRVTGNEIPSRIIPDGRALSSFSLEWRSAGETRQRTTFSMEQLPYHSDNFSPDGKLLVWELPQEGADYAIGIDCADGIGKDNTVIEVVRRGAPGEQDIHVAEWASNKASGLDVWAVVLAIGTWFMSADGARVTMVPEIARDGGALLNELRKRGWRSFHRRRSYTKVGASSATNMLGWLTTSTSRPLVVGHLIKMVKDDWLRINSPWLVRELEDLEESGTRIEARSGAHDDRMMALAIAHYHLYEMERRGEESRRYRNIREELLERDKEIEWTPSRAALPVASEQLENLYGGAEW